LENQGLEKIGLWVGNHNKPALFLYKKHGFKRVFSERKWTKMERQGQQESRLANRKITTKRMNNSINLPYKQAAL